MRWNLQDATEHLNLHPSAMSLDTISKVISQGRNLATHSWEFGTFSESLLEWYNPSLSVFSASPFANGKIPVVQVNNVEALSYAQPHIWTNSTTLVGGDGMHKNVPICFIE
jgi:hypothetical protein